MNDLEKQIMAHALDELISNFPMSIEGLSESLDMEVSYDFLKTKIEEMKEYIRHAPVTLPYMAEKD